MAGAVYKVSKQLHVHKLEEASLMQQLQGEYGGGSSLTANGGNGPSEAG